MTTEEKAKKFEELQAHLWDMALHGNPFQSTIAAALIRQFDIDGPNGEDPESA